MRVTIIGTGLIGGSMALALQKKGLARHITGVESDTLHQQKALAMKLVDEIKPLESAVEDADLVLLAVPVHSIIRLLPSILSQIGSGVVMDVGSTKEAILEAVKEHPCRGRFVATHPMWGT